MRKTHFSVLLLLSCVLLLNVATAATFRLGDGRTVTGDLVESGSNDANALINVGDEKFERVPWGQFSQDDLKEFLQKYAGNKKIVEAVSPFIEVSQEERAKKTEVTIKPVERLNQPPKGSVIGSLFKSGVGLVLILLMYGANIYAGYEIGIFRAQSIPLVTGLAAIPFLGLISNIIFLCLPTRIQVNPAEEAAAAAHEAPTPTIAIPGQEEAVAQAAAVAAAEVAAGPKPEVYNRRQFTFNKRFIESKFPNFFGMIRREEDRTKVLTFKTSKGEFVVHRISRITPTEVHIEVERGGAHTEVGCAFPEIQEIILRHQP